MGEAEVDKCGALEARAAEHPNPRRMRDVTQERGGAALSLSCMGTIDAAREDEVNRLCEPDALGVRGDQAQHMLCLLAHGEFPVGIR